MFASTVSHRYYSSLSQSAGSNHLAFFFTYCMTSPLCLIAFVECTEISGKFVKDQKADFISIFYDVGGIIGECEC